MAISFERKAYGGGKPIFWRGECKVLPGGFKLKNELPVGTIIDKGAMLHIDFSDMSAFVFRYAVLMDKRNSSSFKVHKGHLGHVGDEIDEASFEAPVIITSIDTSNADYDIINLNKTVDARDIDSLSFKETSFEIDETTQPNAVVAAELVIDGKGLPTIDAAYEALIISKNVNPADEFLSDGKMCLIGNPSIKYINQ